ncbi:MAG: hypothetical protein WD428_03575 [Gaiellaceae bacterium]
MAVGMIGRTPIVARVGAGFYVVFATGYPVLNRIGLWQVGAASTRLIAKTTRTGNTTATLAADVNGRLWVAWTNNVGATPRVFARRSNAAATVFGAVVNAGRPTRASSIYRISTDSALDLFANTSIGISSTSSTFERRIFPGLTLTANPRRLHRGRTSQVTFRVRDAGDPVAGARVRSGGKSGTTNANGKVTLELLGRNRSVTATARASNYTAATLRLRVVA